MSRLVPFFLTLCYTYSLPMDDVYLSILKIHKNINKQYAANLSYEISETCIDLKIPCYDFISMLYLESSFKIDAFNPESKDYSICQLNNVNITTYDKSRLFKKKKEILLNNLDKIVYTCGKVFKWFYLTYSKKEPITWIARYNCGTRKNCINWKTSKKYIKRIEEIKNEIK